MSAIKDRIPSLKNPSVISILVFAVGYFLFIAPPLDNLAKVEKEESELKDQFEHKQRKLVNLQPLKDQMRKMSTELGYFHRVLPHKINVDAVKDEVNRQAEQYAVDIHTMDFDIEMPLEYYVSKPFYLDVSGNFDDLYYFIYDVFYASGKAITLGEFIIQRTNPNSTLELKIQGSLISQLHEEE